MAAVALLQALNRFDAIHRRHLPVQQQQIVGQTVTFRGAHHIQCLFAIPGDIHFESEAPGHGGNDFSRRSIVVHDQNAYAEEFVLPEYTPRRRLHLDAEARFEMERRTLSHRDLHPNPSVHHLDQCFGNRESEPGSAKIAGSGSVCLAETLEHLAALLRSHADTGVTHPEMEFDRIRCLSDYFGSDHYLSLLGDYSRGLMRCS